MEVYRLELIETIVVFVALLVIRFIIKHYINRALKKFHFSLQRRRITTKILNIFLVIFAFVGITGIWGIEQEKLTIFISSVLTIIGVAFFAQWSILSNITAGLILYFNHPLKLGDDIKVLEKDFIIEGTIDDITFFFVYIKSKDGNIVTIPNSVVLQKNISISSNSINKKNSKTSIKQKTPR